MAQLNQSQTALITGASGGIGLELARLFARRKFNLVLVARTQEKLEEITRELSASGISVLSYTRDLSNPANAEDIYNDLRSLGIEIDYLVNNAGFGISGTETDIPWDRELQMLSLNMLTLTYFTKMFASDMASRGFGRIMNVGSTGSFQPGPYMAGYCASKAYVLHFSEAVNRELKGTGVIVTTLCPGVTDTGFHVTAQTESSTMFTKLSHASAREVAEYGFGLMMKGKSYGVHGLFNKLMVFSVRFSPRNLVTQIAAGLLKS
ncbi:MAG: SDR family oxidoreductase [Bacteroidota bacterium]|nr:SDR family oxidoreductase [Bacteroidota bacterium]